MFFKGLGNKAFAEDEEDFSKAVANESDDEKEEDMELNKAGGNEVNFTDSEDEDVSIKFTKRLIFQQAK